MQRWRRKVPATIRSWAAWQLRRIGRLQRPSVLCILFPVLRLPL